MEIELVARIRCARAGTRLRDAAAQRVERDESRDERRRKARVEVFRYSRSDRDRDHAEERGEELARHEERLRLGPAALAAHPHAHAVAAAVRAAVAVPAVGLLVLRLHR